MFFGRVMPIRPDIKLFPVIHVFNLLTLSLVTQTLVFILGGRILAFSVRTAIGIYNPVKIVSPLSDSEYENALSPVLQNSLL
jgi:hypothetical protein